MPRLSRSLRLLLCLAVATGCSEAETVITPEPQRPLQPLVRTVVEQPTDIALAVDGGRVLVSSDEGLRLLRTSEDQGVIVADAANAGALRDVYVGEHNVVVASDNGLFILHDIDFFSSPLQGSLEEGERARSFEPSPAQDGQETFWMLTDRGLYRVEGSNLRTIGIPDVTGWDSAVMGRAPGIRGSVLWLAIDGRLFELGVSRGNVFVGEVRIDLQVTSMATDGLGDLWLVADESLYRLTSDRDLERFVLPVTPSRVEASEKGPDLWVEGEGGLWHLADDLLRFVEITLAEESTLRAEGDGTILVAGGTGLSRYRARRSLELGGITDGSRITGTTQVAIMPEAGDVANVRAYLDGESIRVLEEPLALELEPLRIGEGSHRLRVEVEYMDGTLPAFLEYTLVVGQNVTWSNDVLPIMEQHCARCHGSEESASTRLDTRQTWIDNADSIIYNVREGRMPLDDQPLLASEVDLVLAWKASGFPE